jgi:multidrug efflux pump subunit AcrA (membrane-fusion protein)
VGKWIFLLLAGGAAALAGWLYFRSSRPPEAPFARPRVEPVESVITTNGKIEPANWMAVRAEIAGVIASVPVERGQRVRKGQTVAAMEAREARAELASAEARIEQARAEIATLERGGRPSEVAAIEADIARAELDRTQAARDLAAIERLIAKRAATQTEADQARDRIDRANAQIAAARARRKALVNPADLESARARLEDAAAAAKLARERIALATVVSPMAGVVYELAVRAGAYVQPGALIASVGEVEDARAVLYVDEPDLGSVTEGLAVTITWDALPARKWPAVVDRVPAQVAPLGTRQVGEVICRVANPGGALLPGTNINAAIRTGRSDSALTIPKEAVRRQGDATGVFVFDGAVARWRPVKLGLASVSRVEVLDGLGRDDAVALPAGLALADGMAVTPVFP